MVFEDPRPAAEVAKRKAKLERWLVPGMFMLGAFLLIMSSLDREPRIMCYSIGLLISSVWLHYNRWFLHLELGSPEFAFERIQKPELLISGSVIAFGAMFFL